MQKHEGAEFLQSSDKVQAYLWPSVTLEIELWLNNPWSEKKKKRLSYLLQDGESTQNVNRVVGNLQRMSANEKLIIWDCVSYVQVIDIDHNIPKIV